jgi:hypothetical protein
MRRMNSGLVESVDWYGIILKRATFTVVANEKDMHHDKENIDS